MNTKLNLLMAGLLTVACSESRRVNAQAPVATQVPEYTVIDLGTLGGSESYAYGINDRGQVVGYSETKSGDKHAFLYADGVMRDLGTLGGKNSYAYGINNHGQVVGSSQTSPVGFFEISNSHAFLYSNGSMKDLHSWEGPESEAYGINAAGQVVGSLHIIIPSYYYTFLYSNGSMNKDTDVLGSSGSEAYGINDASQVVGYYTYTGGKLGGGDVRAFLYSAGVRQNLNDLIDSTSGWRLTVAQAINNAGQIVGIGINPSGKYHAFLLNPLPLWRRLIETKPVQPTYSEPPKKETSKKNLVVVTHGWQPAFLPVDISWVDTMTNAISKYLLNQGLTDWQVHAHRWVEKAHTKNPKKALLQAKEEGISLGRSIAGQEFGHIHLIAHSAGGGLIQAASETIKATRSDIIIHLSFLDPFVGLNYKERENYGKGANWVDSYFSRDVETSGGVFPFTEGILTHSYNIDVSWLDTNQKKIEVISSTPSGEVSQTCYQTVTSHGWPYQFYTATVPPNTLFGSEGFGFPLSKEGGNWSAATNQYKIGNSAPRILGSGELSCAPNLSRTQLQIELPRDFSKLPGASVIINAPEKVNIRGIDFTLKTTSPAWLAATLPITNRVNLVSFEAVFTSASGAEGLLSVYWETNVVSSVDERVTALGMRQYTFPIPETVSTGTRTLGFRLDAFSAIQSSVTVTNVALGFSGVKESFSLSFAGINANGVPLLQLTGPSGFNYAVETSTNLTDWATMALLVNTNGVVRFADPSTNNAAAKFYRAVAP